MTNLKSFDALGIQFAWDATSLSNFAKCPRYYFYKNLQGWQPNRLSHHLVFGGHYARALETHAKLVAQGQTPDDALIAVVWQTLRETWDEETGTPWESYDDNKTRETLIRSIVWYFEEFQGSDEPTETVILSDGTPAVEYSFAYPFHEDIIYCGHIDRLVTYDDMKFVMDQKTTKTTVTPRYFNQFRPDFQMSGYTYSGKILFDLPITGVIIDAAQIAIGFTQFTRGFVHIGEPFLEDWKQNTIEIIRQAQDCTDKGRFPMNFSSCGNYGGCEFRDICSRSPEHRERQLHADFKRAVRWDPLERR